jgi:hypothetical protein
MEQLLAATIDAALAAGAVTPASLTRVTIDTTVRPKAIGFPTDSRLDHRGCEILVRRAAKHGVRLRQSYHRLGNRALRVAALDRIGDEAADEIVRKTVQAAKEGDRQARELVLRRVWPRRTGSRPVAFALPPVSGPAELVEAHARVIAAVSAGTLTPGKGRRADQPAERTPTHGHPE